MSRPHPPARASRLRAFAVIAATFALSGCLRDVFFPRERETPERAVQRVFGKTAVQWFTPYEAGGDMQPLLDGTRVYFDGHMGVAPDGMSLRTLVALDRGTGALAWRTPVTSSGSAAFAADRLGAGRAQLGIYDPASGELRGTYTPGQRTLSGNLVSDGTRFYAATFAGYVVAVNAATGHPAWEMSLAGAPQTTGFGVALSGDAVAVALKHFGPDVPRDSGIVAVVERETGAVRWRTTMQGPSDRGIVEPPVIVGGLVIVVTQGHALRAYDVLTGALRWQADATLAPQGVYSSGLAACEGLVIAATGAPGIAAFDAATGALRWQRGGLGGSTYRVQCSHGTVMTIGAETLQVFDALTGTRRAQYPGRDPGRGDHSFWIASVVRDEQSLYVSTSLGVVKVTAP